MVAFRRKASGQSAFHECDGEERRVLRFPHQGCLQPEHQLQAGQCTGWRFGSRRRGGTCPSAWFTQSELERAKKLYLNAAERQLKMEKDYKNSHYVSQCVNNFLEGEPILTPTYNLQLVKLFDGEVSLAEVNSQVGEIITDKNQVFIMYGPDKDGFVVPSESEIESTVLAAQQKRYDAYQEEQVPATLMAALPAPGKIVSEKPYGKFGMTEIVLSNGMKVYVKSTDYQADQITMSMRGEGGTSVYGDEDIPNFAFLSGSITEAGVGDFTATRLRKALAGKSLKLAPSITSEGQRITGTSSVKDLETMLQLAHLYFTAPRKDSMAFEGMMNRNLSLLKNRNASSKVVYNDSLSATLYDHNVRMAPVTVEIAKKRITTASSKSIASVSAMRATSKPSSSARSIWRSFVRCSASISPPCLLPTRQKRATRPTCLRL